MSNWKQTMHYNLKNGDLVKEWENSKNGKTVRLEQYTNHNKFLQGNFKFGLRKTPKDWRVSMCLFDNCTDEWFNDYKSATSFVSQYKKKNNRSDAKYLKNKRELEEILGGK